MMNKRTKRAALLCKVARNWLYEIWILHTYYRKYRRSKKYTEQEIKAIDERYWPFAVKVEGE